MYVAKAIAIRDEAVNNDEEKLVVAEWAGERKGEGGERG